MASKAALIYTVLPDEESAREIAGNLLDEGLIACANILGTIESHFIWEGKRDSSQECAVLFKTDAERLGQATERLGALHSYDTPAILGWECDVAHPDTLEWLSATLGRA